MRRSIRAAARAGALASLLASPLTLTACSDFERIDFEYTSSLPIDVLLTYEKIRIPEGVAVITTARPMAADSLMARDTAVQFNVANPSVLGVALALPQSLDDTTTSESWSFVFSGASVGETSVVVRIDGVVEGEIPAFVEEQ